MKILLILLILLSGVINTHAHQAHSAHLGTIHFETSGNRTAQPYFEKGVMLLHSFEYNEARANFKKAIILDPNFAMAYWGAALTYYHPLWSEEDPNASQKILNQLSPNPDTRIKKAKMPKESGFIKAINELYGKGDKKVRHIRYSQAMHQLYEKYPHDDEVAIFYALSILGMAEGERDTELYMRSAGILEEIYQHNPEHPGALHYLIHTYDDPIHASLGLRAAQSYAKIAPDAAHALHMPSHIFLALGLWDDVIASNAAAWQAALKQNPTKDPQKFTVDDLHALEWLSYGYLQKCNYKKAYQLIKQIESITESSQSPMAKWYYAIMRAAYISESKDYTTDLKSFNMDEVELSAKASNLYINALIALHKKPKSNIGLAKKIHRQLINSIPNENWKNITYPDYFTSVTSSGIKSARIMSLELEAEIELALKHKQKAYQLLNQAIAMEDKLSLGYGPPIPVKPARELYADVLLENNQDQVAYQQYRLVLKRIPNRAFSLEGIAKAKNIILD